MAVTDQVSRPVRSAAQGGVAWLIVEFIDSFGIYNFTERQYGVAVAMLGVILSWGQVVVENKMGKGFFRRPEPPAKPVEPVEAGEVSLVGVLLVLLVVVVILVLLGYL